MLPGFLDDTELWAEATLHLLECERDYCELCLSIAETCYTLSQELEALVDQRQQRPAA